MGYVRYAVAEKRRLVRAWEGGDESLAEFCRARGVSAGSLRRWRQEMEAESGVAANGTQPLKFVEVDVAPKPATEAAPAKVVAELVLPGGMVLRVFSVVPPC